MDIPTLQSKTRKRYIVQARQLAMFLLKNDKSIHASMIQIGKRLRNCYFTCKTVDNLYLLINNLESFVEDLGKKLSV